MLQNDVSCRVYLRYYTSLPGILCHLSKEKRGRYGEGRIDMEPTVLVVCVL